MVVHSFEKEMEAALRDYFGKIKDPGFFAEFYSCTAPEYLNEIRNGNFVIHRSDHLDYSFFKRNYGYEMPEVLKAYYSYAHPQVAGYHRLTPFKTEAIILYSSISRKRFSGLISDADYWKKYGIIDIEKYIPIGYVTYNESSVVLERDTGRVFVEFGFAEDPADDEEGKLYPTPLAEDLMTFIREIEPYGLRRGE